MKTLYLECTSGISGDMTVAALLDLGASETALREGLASLNVAGYEIEIGRVKKSGIDACDFTVRLEAEGQDHHHDHQTKHEHSHCDSGHEHHHHEQEHHHHDSEHEHHHHGQEHHHHDSGHVHRNLSDILQIIDSSGIAAHAKHIARRIFSVVAEAEAKVHGLPLEKVHFHEVGAVDSIVDIVGAAICIDNLGIGQIICSPLREGTGTVRCQHGLMPVPAPATLAIVEKYRIPLVITDNVGEMVTPTGAAIVGAMANTFSHPQEMRILATGYGAGKREYKTANLLRAMLVDPNGGADSMALLLECNLDDMTGEQLGYACELLLAAGALDVWCTPIIMKKSRPAQKLSVLCEHAKEQQIVGLLMRHTSTIGVRSTNWHRHVMGRTARTVQTPYGPVQVKDCTWDDIHKTTVEYESARQVADSCNIPIDEVYRSAYNK